MVTDFRLSVRSSMDSLADIHENAWTYDEMVAAAAKNVDLYTIARAHAVAPPEFAQRVEATDRRWHLLSMSEDWCGDSVNTLPWVDALAASTPRLDHRIIRRDEHLDLMDAHLTNGTARAIPIVVLLDERFVERAWWGPRPRELQMWFESAEAQAMTKDERYKVLRTRYARDRGRAIMHEIVAMIEAVAARDAAAAQDAVAAAATAQAEA
jgi:hypothetical protein